MSHVFFTLLVLLLPLYSLLRMHIILSGTTVVSPYVGMARKQDDSSNVCISNYTVITWLGAGFTHFYGPNSRYRVLPLSTRTYVIPESIAKLVNP